MQVEGSLGVEVADDMDFAALLDAYFAEDDLERGDIVTGTVLSVDSQGLIVGVGTDRDGFVSRRDIERLGMQPEDYTPGQDVDVTIVRMEDDEGNLVLSVSQARQSEDWKLAESLLEDDQEWEGEVADANRGGLIMLFGNLRGFVPASHVVDLPRGLSEEDRTLYLQRLVGGSIKVKVIEVNRKRRRLVFSQRDAERETREARKETLLDELKEGEVRKGIVSGLRDFGAFVDLGGADGLIHISELAWHRVKHPRDVLNVGDDVEVYVLRLDNEGKRIGLSLKRLQPNPWSMVEDMYHIGQLVEGLVSRTAQFGAFISLDPGIEALLHASQISDPPPEDVTHVIREGEMLLMRVISIEADKQRLGLSLREVTEEEQDRWVEQRGVDVDETFMEDDAVVEVEEVPEENAEAVEIEDAVS
jgi:small subunit ribosomal protein S1